MSSRSPCAGPGKRHPAGRGGCICPGRIRMPVSKYQLRKQLGQAHGCTWFRCDLLLRWSYPKPLVFGERILVSAATLVCASIAALSLGRRINQHPGCSGCARDAESLVRGFACAYRANARRCAAIPFRFTCRSSGGPGEIMAGSRHGDFTLGQFDLAGLQALRLRWLGKVLRLFIWSIPLDRELCS